MPFIAVYVAAEAILRAQQGLPPVDYAPRASSTGPGIDDARQVEERSIRAREDRQRAAIREDEERARESRRRSDKSTTSIVLGLCGAGILSALYGSD